jgi:hypothetical protein
MIFILCGPTSLNWLDLDFGRGLTSLNSLDLDGNQLVIVPGPALLHLPQEHKNLLHWSGS